MTVDICGVPFKVVEKAEFITGEAIGCISIQESTIFIDGSLSKPLKDSTLVHEWLHGVLGMYGVEHEEAIVAILGAELYRYGFRVKTSK